MFFDSTRKKSIEELFGYSDYSDDEVNDVRWVNDWFFIRVSYIRVVHVHNGFYVIPSECQSAGFSEIKKKTGTKTTITTVAIANITTIFALPLPLLFFFIQFSTNFCDRRRCRIPFIDDFMHSILLRVNVWVFVCVCVCCVVFVRRIQNSGDVSTIRVRTYYFHVKSLKFRVFCGPRVSSYTPLIVPRISATLFRAFPRNSNFVDVPSPPHPSPF